MSKEPDQEIDAAKLQLFLEAVTVMELTRLSGTEKNLEASQFPMDISILRSLRVLRLIGDEILSDQALDALVGPDLEELDLSGQRLTTAKLEELLAKSSDSPNPSSLKTLRLRRNQLQALPTSSILRIKAITELDASDNKLTEVPSTLLQLMPLLEVLNLEGNRLTVPSLDFRDCRLRKLLLGLNSLEYLPTLAPLTQLVELSVYSLRISALASRGDPLRVFEAASVRAFVLRPTTSTSASRDNPLTGSPRKPHIQLFPPSKEAKAELRIALGCLFKSSASVHHLVSALLALLASEPMYRDQLGSEFPSRAGLQHLLAMCQAPEPVALDACVALSRMVVNEEHARALLDLLVVERLFDLISHSASPVATSGRTTVSVTLRLYALQVLRAMAISSPAINDSLLGTTHPGGPGRSAAADTAGSNGVAPKLASGVQYRMVISCLLALLRGGHTSLLGRGMEDLKIGVSGLEIGGGGFGWSAEEQLAVQCCVLGLLGDLAFSEINRQLLLSDSRVLAAVRSLTEAAVSSATATQQARGSPPRNQSAAVVLDRGDDREAAPKAVAPAGAPSAMGLWSPMAADEGAAGGERRPRPSVSLDAGTRMNVVSAARRVLAILGDNETLRMALTGGVQAPAAVQAPGHGGERGLRVLAVDGGGVKGISSIRVLAALEQQCGAPLHSLFDLVAGTSAGGIVATGIGQRLNMVQCEGVYRIVSRKAFTALKDPPPDPGRASPTEMPEDATVASAAGAAGASGTAGGGGAGAAAGVETKGAGARGKGEEKGSSAGWWQKLVHSGAVMQRVVMTGAKWDAGPFVLGLREGLGPGVDKCMIDSAMEAEAVHTCKTAIVATLCSVRPVTPFVFRNYQLPPGVSSCYPGSCRHTWLEAMRASAAAPYYFEELACRGERFQDGGLVANNPAIIAVHEALRLWPGRKLDLLVSVGTGRAPEERREVKRYSGGLSLIGTLGEIVVESASSSDRVSEALEVLSPLMPQASYFRLQVEDERCNIDIDDNSPESAQGLVAATDAYIAANPAVFATIAGLLTGPPEQPPRKHGIGAGLVVMVVQSNLSSAFRRYSLPPPLHTPAAASSPPTLLSPGPAQAALAALSGSRPAALVHMLDSVGVQCELRSLDTAGRAQGSEAEPRGESGRRAERLSATQTLERFLGLLRQSPARVVHVACETLRSGGDVVLEWYTERVRLTVDQVWLPVSAGWRSCQSPMTVRCWCQSLMPLCCSRQSPMAGCRYVSH